MRTVFVTADDYGYNAAVDDGILALAEAGRLAGAGCMTRAPGWRAAAARIPVASPPASDAGGDEDDGSDQGQICGWGLHLDLTEFSPQRRGLWPLIGASLARRLDPAALREEIAAQCMLFEDATGRAPDYVDGHQHVHQLPQVREALVEVLAARYAGRLPWLRISGARIGDGAKALFIAALGADELERLATAAGMDCMPRLLGAYGFDGDAESYRRRLGDWLARAADGHALMVHPATGALSGDPIGPARVREYGVLMHHLPGLMAATGTGPGSLARTPAGL